LGHHRDDILETFFLNLFFAGRLKAMPPKLRNDDGDLVVIRPLAYCAEEDLARYARGMNFPIIPCSLCGSQENAQRRQVKAMLRTWEREDPRRIASIFTALGHAVPSHLLDRALFDFTSLSAGAEEAEAAPDEAAGAAPMHFFGRPVIRT
jgi:tRNA 2-thiocytidine biosynthesis protein TtcA